jgi:hypothetical protein
MGSFAPRGAGLRMTGWLEASARAGRGSSIRPGGVPPRRDQWLRSLRRRACGWGSNPPRGRREPSRRSVRSPSGQTGGWRRWPRPSVSCEGGEQRGSARRAVSRRRRDRTRRRVGGLRSMRSPSDRSKPAGQENSHGVARKPHLAARGSSKQPRERPARPIRRPGTGPDCRRAAGANDPSVVCVTLRCCSIFIHLLVSVGFVLTRLPAVWQDLKTASHTRGVGGVSRLRVV